MAYSVWQSPVTGRRIRIHWNSWIARLGGSTNCMTLSAGHIFVACNRINAPTLAHEDGHSIQAAKRGWLYLPWVLWGYATKGYAKSKAEVEADEHMTRYLLLYRTLWEGS